MALQIDVSDPSKLTRDEILYLQDRDKLPEGVEPIPQSERVEGETVMVATAQGSATVPKSRLSEFTGHTDSDDEEIVEVESYADLSDDDLRAELKARGLTTTGKTETMVKRLEDDDASKANG